MRKIGFQLISRLFFGDTVLTLLACMSRERVASQVDEPRLTSSSVLHAMFLPSSIALSDFLVGPRSLKLREIFSALARSL